jgi:hypothetical protein
MRELMNKVGSMEYDGLLTDITPPEQTRGGVIARLSDDTEYKRGTIFARNTADQKLYILGTTITGQTFLPFGILCDNCVVSKDEDLNQVLYTAGCFHPDKVTVKDGYDITATDLDELRKRDIVFRLPHAAN